MWTGFENRARRDGVVPEVSLLTPALWVVAQPRSAARRTTSSRERCCRRALGLEHRAGSLMRNPDGKDTNAAAADWGFTTTITRGAANVMTP